MVHASYVSACDRVRKPTFNLKQHSSILNGVGFGTVKKVFYSRQFRTFAKLKRRLIKIKCVIQVCPQFYVHFVFVCD